MSLDNAVCWLLQALQVSQVYQAPLEIPAPLVPPDSLEPLANPAHQVNYPFLYSLNIFLKFKSSQVV